MRAIQRRNTSSYYQIKGDAAMAKKIITKIAIAYQRSFVELYKRDNK